MGYIYTRQGRLCCDICGQPGARKAKCPFGYCQPIAVCPTCRKNHKSELSKEKHRERGCEKRHLAFVAHELEREAMLISGKAVRCSALGVDPSMVHVLFDRQDGTTEGWLMHADTYKAIELGVNATPDDYRKFGELHPAPDEFQFGRSKRVA
jgi:hypothetical protein